MNIEIWSIGKENESFIENGIQHYFKKIKPYCPIRLEIISVKKKSSEINQQKKIEEELILKKLQAGHHLVLLDEKGKMMNSPEVAQMLQHKMNQRVKTLVFLIGGAFGVTETIRKQAQTVWSLSELVFPHQLVRLILSEQIYRAFSILNNTSYHHE